jgi:hypothetical protein
MVDESVLCLKRCTHASVRRMDLQILCSRHCLGLVASSSGGDLDRAERWASVALTTYAHTYVTVTLSIGKKAVRLRGLTVL